MAGQIAGMQQHAWTQGSILQERCQCSRSALCRAAQDAQGSRGVRGFHGDQEHLPKQLLCTSVQHFHSVARMSGWRTGDLGGRMAFLRFGVTFGL